MIRIESWARQPEGIIDVTLLQDRRHYTYQLRSERDFDQFITLIKHERYDQAFALVSATPASDRGAKGPSEGRERPDPAGENAKAGAGSQTPETGWLWPEASQEIASAFSRRVMLYPY